MTEFELMMKKLRNDRKLHAFELASMLEISPSFLCLIEKGERTPPEGFINKIAKALKLTEPERIKLMNAKCALPPVRKKEPTTHTTTKQIKKEADRLLNELYIQVESGKSGDDLISSIMKKLEQMNQIKLKVA
jgi:transcriptional regulator with XRE-family HTH domain